MKRTHEPFGSSALKTGPTSTTQKYRARIRDEITRAKRSAMTEYSPEAGEHLRLLRLALNEAEALAWQTEYPHLVFPGLAVEKAQATVRWQKRQHAVRVVAPQLSLSE
jgi:hypothetical protein